MVNTGLDFGACGWRLPGGTLDVEFWIISMIGRGVFDHVFNSEIAF